MLYTIQILRQLFTDFPSTDPTVRLVILLTVFLSDNCLAHTTPATLRSKLEPLGLLPLTRKDIFNVLTNPFVERYAPILEFAKVELGLNAKVIRELVEEVAVACLEVGCKVCFRIPYPESFSVFLQLLDCRVRCCEGCLKDSHSCMIPSRWS
jgi:hypothetical protein